MADKDLFEILADLIVDYSEFSDEHPILSIVLTYAAIAGIGQIGELLDSNNGSGQESIDVNALAIKNQKERQELEEQLGKSIGEKIRDCGEKLAFLEKDALAHLKTPDFSFQLQEARELYDEVRGLSKWEQEQNASYIQKLHHCILSLHSEYTQIENAWKAAKSEWETRWNQVRDLLQQGQNFPIQANTSNGQETVCVDCEFWSRGALSDAGNALPPLTQPEDTSTTAFNALSQQADQLYQRIADILHQAGQNFVHAQMRIQLGNSIVKSLYARGWYLEADSDYGFINDDQREDLTLKLYSPVGDVLEFVLKPDSTIQMRPKFQNIHNRNLLQLLAQVLQSALRSNGITVANVSL